MFTSGVSCTWECLNPWSIFGSPQKTFAGHGFFPFSSKNSRIELPIWGWGWNFGCTKLYIFLNIKIEGPFWHHYFKGHPHMIPKPIPGGLCTWKEFELYVQCLVECPESTGFCHKWQLWVNRNHPKRNLTQFFLVCKSSIHGPWLPLSDYHRLVVIKTPCALFGGTFELSKETHFIVMMCSNVVHRCTHMF